MLEVTVFWRPVSYKFLIILCHFLRFLSPIPWGAAPGNSMSCEVIDEPYHS